MVGEGCAQRVEWTEKQSEKEEREKKCRDQREKSRRASRKDGGEGRKEWEDNDHDRLFITKSCPLGRMTIGTHSTQ